MTNPGTPASGRFTISASSCFPPTGRAVSALIDDLHERGLLDDVLIMMAATI